MNDKLYELASRAYSIARAGQTYSTDRYDLDRYRELNTLALELMSIASGAEISRVQEAFQFENGYNTPKVDVRGVIFRDNKILMVREIADGGWTLPGGWADWGLTPSENVLKEVAEEAGFSVRPLRLLAVLDKKKHPHPPDLFHIYKIFIECELLASTSRSELETSDVQFFSRDEIPVLSEGRTTASQLRLMFEFQDNPLKNVVFD